MRNNHCATTDPCRKTVFIVGQQRKEHLLIYNRKITSNLQRIVITNNVRKEKEIMKRNHLYEVVMIETFDVVHHTRRTQKNGGM
jgi:hypothetical protein